MRAERSEVGPASGRGYPSPRSGSGGPRDRAPRAPQGRPPVPVDPRRVGHPGEQRRPAAPVDAATRDGRRTGASATRRRIEPAPGPRVHGAVSVLGIFLVTLLAAGLDSFLSSGLGLISVVALTLSAVAAGLVTRRRDLLTVVVAPPLVYVLVAVANVALAPSATLSLPSLATLLVRGFPAMGIATGAAVVVSLFRLATRR